MKRRPATDIQRICERCGVLTWCFLKMTHNVNAYGVGERTSSAVCPKCLEKEKAQEVKQ